MSDGARAARSLLGMPVYSLAEGRHVGEVDALYVRPDTLALGALGVKGDGHRRTLRFELVTSIGDDAVTVQSEEMLQGGPTSQSIRALDTHLSGRRALTESGEVVGTVAGYLLDTRTGKIDAFRIRCEAGLLGRLAAMVRDDAVEVPATMVVSLGPSALVVRDEAMSGHSAPAASHPDQADVTEDEDSHVTA